MNPERRLAPFYRLLIRDVIFGLLSRGIDAEGQNFIPQQGPAIVVINHMGWAEFLLPPILLPQKPTTMTKEENLAIPIIGKMAKDIGFFPVDRGEVDRRALNRAMDVLRQGGFFVTSPEGTRGRENLGNRRSLTEAKNGVLYIAKKVATELRRPVPISSWAVWGGPEWIFPELEDKTTSLASRLLWKREETHVRIAPSILVQPLAEGETLTSKYLQPKSDALMIAIRDMLPPRYAGHYEGKTAVVSPGGTI